MAWLEVSKIDNRGQFSIIAALFVAVILISSVMITYSSIRYGYNQAEPQILSAIDETNLALKQVLGFTVGYYGSVLQVTGNSSYARALANNYLDTGLQNIADVRPEWGASFTVTGLSLNTNWFTNASYSKGTINITYALTGLGISGIAYSASCRLDVQISPSLPNKVCLTVIKDQDQPVNDLGFKNFKFYLYQYTNLTWQMQSPESEPLSFSNGTYLVDIPDEVNPYSYAIQVSDSRGIMVAASSYSHYTSTLTFNSTFVDNGHYVDNCGSQVDVLPDEGTHSNFAAQQTEPDNQYDTLIEENIGTQPQNYCADSYSPLGATTRVSGGLSDTQSNDADYMTFRAYPSAFSESSIFGYQSIGSSTQSIENVIAGSSFAMPTGGIAQNISAYIGFTSGTQNFGNQGLESKAGSIEGVIRGTIFSPTYDGMATSITAYIDLGDGAFNRHVKAALYTSGHVLIASTEEVVVSSDGWVTFDFSEPNPTLTASTNYLLVVWSDSGTGSVELRYRTGSYTGYSQSQNYGSWPSSLQYTNQNSHRYSIFCTYQPTARVKAAIYSDWHNLVAMTEQKIVYATGWVTFDFEELTFLNAATNYVLAVWSNSALDVNLYYHSGSSYQGHEISRTYGSWPSSPNFDHDSREYSIYCSYAVPSQYTCQVEFSGLSNTNNWNNLLWAVDASSTLSGIKATLQLYNYQSEQYPTSGEGYLTTTLESIDNLADQMLTVDPESYRDEIGRWKLRLTAVESITSPFEISFDLVQYQPGTALYALDLEEQWVNVDTSSNFSHPALCIKVGSLGSGNLAVDVWHTGSWRTLSNALVRGWNNLSIAQYIDSTFTIRFKSSADTVLSSWEIDATLIRSESDQKLFLSLTNTVATIELLQNGTMRWLGQNLRLTTEAVPIPPVPIKSIHVNQTLQINSTHTIEQEVPFQIEDWSSDYTVPLGLTNNATVFSNRQMIVFLLTTNVTRFTIWWNGSDGATQTPLAYTNRYFTADNPDSDTLSNGRLRLQFGSEFTVTSTVVGTSTSSTANYMRINNEASTYGARPAYVIHHGIVRDIVQQEAEWGGGANGCPNLYANIVLTLPANATYYTYQLGLMFINSTQPRTITDLCPIELTCSIGQLQTENGTIRGDPVIALGSQTFSSNQTWIHHWSQFIDGKKGAGIMFTDTANQMLYAFDDMAPTSLRGALKATSIDNTIELLPVTLNPVSFQYALNIVWYGAVATFDNAAPPIYNGFGQPGLWILAELPPTIAVTTDN